MREIAREADTFAFEPSMSEQQGYDAWVQPPPGRTIVAVENERILGTAKVGPIRPGPGSHVATASFMVSAEARGKGLGGELCRYVLAWAKQRGYAGMQFNAVVESNHAAVRLYEQLGFEIVGTVPGAFTHPTLGRVGLHIMYCAFS